MKRLINKLKKLIGMNTPSEYTIFYTNPLTMEQKSQLINHMITKFSICRPNRLTVGQQIATLDFTSPCLTGEALKIVSDNTLAPKPADITSIKLDGNIIWTKP